MTDCILPEEASFRCTKISYSSRQQMRAYVIMGGKVTVRLAGFTSGNDMKQIETGRELDALSPSSPFYSSAQV